MNCRDTLIAELHKRSLQSVYELLGAYIDWSNSDDPDIGVETLPEPLSGMVKHIRNTVEVVDEAEATRVKRHIEAWSTEKLTTGSLIIDRFFDGHADIKELPVESINDLHNWLSSNLPKEMLDLFWRTVSDEWYIDMLNLMAKRGFRLAEETKIEKLARGFTDDETESD